ncbi:IclR family transcriptional regulator [Georgenia sp. Z1491]|uniref:IclR family transcriptional regulator n=1 Tax=Georgenia sp. Z1491 TaxID=3416707 RepID=UPI003CED0789
MSDQADERRTSVDNALKLLDELVRRGEIRVHEAATFLGVARSTAHRLLAALVRHGFVRQRTAGGPYVPMVILDRPVVPKVTHERMIAAAAPVVRALRDETEETSHLALLQGNSVRFVVGYQGSRDDSTPLRTGMVLPAHATAVGKVMLAALPAESLRHLYPRGVQVLTDATLRTEEEIGTHLRDVARRGHATNIAESAEGLTAVAVIVRDAEAAPAAAIAVAGPAERMPAVRLPYIVSRMHRAALDIQAELLGPARP